jgi:hypothetical protein
MKRYFRNLVGKGVHRRFGISGVELWISFTRRCRSSSSCCHRCSARCSGRCFLAICSNPPIDRAASVSAPRSGMSRIPATETVRVLSCGCNSGPNIRETVGPSPSIFLRPPRHRTRRTMWARKTGRPIEGGLKHSGSLEISRPARPVPGLPLRLR